MPLSPHLQIYRWPITMAASLAHRATGIALAGGTLFLAWWLIAAASGPDAYENFAAAAAHPLGRFVLFGFVWSLAFHLLNGIRHLAWDLGYGFKVPTARVTAAVAFGLSFLMALAVFAAGYAARGEP
jgi:succinate dehydrogenase / fumarate reductase cytochrome b subunit